MNTKTLIAAAALATAATASTAGNIEPVMIEEAPVVVMADTGAPMTGSARFLPYIIGAGIIALAASGGS